MEEKRKRVVCEIYEAGKSGWVVCEPVDVFGPLEKRWDSIPPHPTLQALQVSY